MERLVTWLWESDIWADVQKELTVGGDVKEDFTNGGKSMHD